LRLRDMTGRHDNATYYRFRAEELRTKAGALHPENQPILMKIADDYERMALTLAGIDRTMSLLNRLCPADRQP